MKTVHARQKLIVIAFLSFGLLALLQSPVIASVAENVRGFAWSGGVGTNPPGYGGMGWISMNNLSDGSGISYGVNVPATDGALSGYAWAGAFTPENYGWISFNGADLAGCVPALAQAVRSGDAVTGGARILAIRDEGANDGGFDGCISLSGTAQDGSPYGLTVNTATTPATLDGYAWSSDLGWINFNGNGGTVEITGLTPNLESSNVTPFGVSTLVKGTSRQFNADVSNTSAVPAGAFSTEFSYRWGTSGAFITLNTLPHASLGSLSSETDLSSSLTLSNSGTLEVKYCVDVRRPPSEGDVAEEDELDNCTTASFGVIGGDLSADPTTIDSGDTTDLTWTTEGPVGSCTVSGGSDSWSGQSDTRTSSALTTTTTYTLVCDGTLLDSVQITVTDPSITAVPPIVPSGTPTTVRWDPHGLINCTVTGGGLNEVAVGPGQQDATIDARTTFSLTCDIDGTPTIVDTVTVNVTGFGQES